ncbi:1,4-dihydroxy-6-naphtoate synthase [bacterium HR33]|nr:1,4-dihydroxy-6-naphtoate synthase [bacterium HR33]
MKSAPAVTITLAHSPDADDAFMFYALARGKIPTGDRHYRHELADIETLNRRALQGELEVTAVSVHTLAHVAERYAVLSHGASVGESYGPRLVAARPAPSNPRMGLAGLKVAVPGTLTTAYLALRLYQPQFEAVVIPFDRIEEAVLERRVDAGLLIHEGQLTYADRGLHLWADLGEWWQEETGLPLPLGVNVARSDLGAELIEAVAADLKASIAYALEHRDEALEYALGFARGLDRSRADRFVGMYVNHFTLDLGERGRRAVEALLERAAASGLAPAVSKLEFIGA